MQAAPQSTATPRRPSDPLPHAPLPHAPLPRQQPVKAELVTTELDDEPQNNPRNGLQQAPPPYHIAAARSKQASTFSALHTNTNGNSYNNSNNANGNLKNNGKGSGNVHVNNNKKVNGGQQVRSYHFRNRKGSIVRDLCLSQ